MAKHVIHMHSSQVVGGGAKLPQAEQIEYGELALNYAKGYESISLKNNQDEIVSFKLNSADSSPYEISIYPEDSLSFEGETGGANVELDADFDFLSMKEALDSGRKVRDKVLYQTYGIEFVGTILQMEGQWMASMESIYVPTAVSGTVDGMLMIIPYNNAYMAQFLLYRLNDGGSSTFISHINSLERSISANEKTIIEHYQQFKGFSGDVLNIFEQLPEAYIGKSYPNSVSGEVFNDYDANKAPGEYSHAEGRSSVASGDYSHAEGYGTSAIGLASHSEGWKSIAKGGTSHAEGYNVLASGNQSHAEGFATSAIGLDSHSEGDRTLALSDCSHSEGQNTAAKGSYSHAEGITTLALGSASHAEGCATSALNDYEHASGRFNISISSDSESASTRFTVGKGDAPTSCKNIFELKENGDLYLHGIGGFDGTNSPGSTADTCDAVSLQKVINDNEEVTAAALNDLDGRITELSNKGGGVGMISPGSTSGEVFNDYGGNKATGDYSHAEGYNTLSFGNKSHAEGSGSTANGVASHAEGLQTIASGVYSHAEGFRTKAIGGNSHSEGLGTSAIGVASHAEGRMTIASGDNSHTEGYMTKANGMHSHAEGNNTEAYSPHSHAGGSYSRAVEDGSFAHGYYVSATLPYSVAFGQYNRPVSGTSIAGYNTMAASAQTIFSIGNGSSATRRNLFEIKSNGDVYIYGLGSYNGVNSPGNPNYSASVKPLQDLI